jgi:hypothetical protein
MYGAPQILVKFTLATALILFPSVLRAQVETETGDTTVIIETPAVDVSTYKSNSDFEDKLLWADSTVPLTRHLPDSVISNLKKDEDFWYADGSAPKPQQQKQNDGYVPLSQRTWFRVLFWLVVVGGFVAFIIWYLSGTTVGMFRKKSRAHESHPVTEEIPEDIFAINYAREIEKAAQSGNYRLAIRLMFLQLLKNMSERNIINYKQDRTNFDYLLQLNSTRFYNDFFRITRNYEYSWYGKFDISPGAYSVIKTDFTNFTNQL